MKKNIQSLKGMHDYLPKECILLDKIYNIFKKILSSYNYLEIKLPILEKTTLFKQTIGLVTDIIGKEMYSFNDKKGNSITLRPEATTSCVRSIIQHKLLYHRKLRLWYYGPMFRYERPQKGRYRQFYQMGVETFGLSEPEIELELIMIINKFLKKLKISNFLTLEINCIGSIESRIQYQKYLKKFLKENISFLDKNSLRQLKENPLRILDSKNINIQKLLLKAPILMDFIEKKSKINFKKLCNLMNYFNIVYTVNTNLVRGLDYYNNTVFEWKTNALGTQNTICAGGRYDILVEKLGGKNTPAIGLAIGMDRLFLLIKTLFNQEKDTVNVDIFIFFACSSNKISAILLAEKIRNYIPKLKIEIQFHPINLHKILKKINKYSTKIILFLGEQEIKTQTISIYNVKKKIYIKIRKNQIIKIINSIFYPNE